MSSHGKLAGGFINPRRQQMEQIVPDGKGLRSSLIWPSNGCVSPEIQSSPSPRHPQYSGKPGICSNSITVHCRGELYRHGNWGTRSQIIGFKHQMKRRQSLEKTSIFHDWGFSIYTTWTLSIMSSGTHTHRLPSTFTPTAGTRHVYAILLHPAVSRFALSNKVFSAFPSNQVSENHLCLSPSLHPSV